MKPRIFIALSLAATLAGGVWPASVHARPFGAHTRNFETVDYSRMPAFCYDRLLGTKGKTSAKGQKEARWMGDNCFSYSNHYCYALVDIQQYFEHYSEMTKVEREGLFQGILGEFGYFEKQNLTSCPIMPNLWLDEGRFLAMDNRFAEAAVLFEKSVRMNPKFIPGYIALADVYKHAGQTGVARQILEHAEKVAPGNAAVRKSLAKLGSGSPPKAKKP